MNLLGRAQDGIGGAGLVAAGAPYAEVFQDFRHLRHGVRNLGQVHFHTQLGGQQGDHFPAPGWAKGDRGLVIGQGLGRPSTAWKAALTAL